MDLQIPIGFVQLHYVNGSKHRSCLLRRFRGSVLPVTRLLTGFRVHLLSQYICLALGHGELPVEEKYFGWTWKGSMLG